MRKFIGPLLLAIGGLDLVVVVLEFSPQFAAMIKDGVFNAVQWPGMEARLFDREAAFWHLFAGLLVTLLGALAFWVLTVVGTLPVWFGWALILVAALGVMLMPVSGFWALFVPAAMVLLLPRHTPDAPLQTEQRF